MKVITLKKFRKISYITFGVIMTLIIAGTLFPVSVSLSEDTINSTIEKKLPLTINKEINNPITKGKETVVAKIQSNKLILEDIGMATTTSGVAIYKDKSVRFTVDTHGSDLHYDSEKFAFFYKPKAIDVKLNQEDLDKIIKLKKIAVKEVEQAFKDESSSESEPKQSLFSKFKKKIKNYKSDDGAKVETKVGTFTMPQKVIDKYKNQAVDKYNNAVENGLKQQIEGFIISGVEWGTVKALQTTPVYKLKDKEVDNNVKLFLTGVKVSKGELSIQFSTANILKGSIGILLLVGIFFIFIELLSSKVEKQERVKIFNVFEVVLDMTAATIEATGSVLEGVGEVGGGLLDA